MTLQTIIRFFLSLVNEDQLIDYALDTVIGMIPADKRAGAILQARAWLGRAESELVERH